MKILFVAAEVAPFVSIGGLSQVMYFLPRALRELGHDVRIFTPKYGAMEIPHHKKSLWKMKPEMEGLRVPIFPNLSDTQLKIDKKDYLQCNVKSHSDKRKGIYAYFLENREYYELRANVFGYMDDHIRFALLSKGCLEWLLQKQAGKKRQPSVTIQAKDTWFPDVIHCNDWHTSYLAEMARKDERYAEVFEKVAIVTTVHNFAYQGNYDYRFAPKDSADDGSKPLEPILSPKLQQQNALLRGLLHADAVNTVSPTHAIEVLTKEYAEGLDTTLQKVRGKLVGILNGLDTDEFNPAEDTIIKVRFTEKNFLKARKKNKEDVQKTFALPVDATIPLLGFSGRLYSQKGVDMLLEVIPQLFLYHPDMQMIILGGGDDRYRNKLLELQKKFPKQLGLHLQADFRLPRKIFAGVDIFLIPSVYEPGGIVALEALRYGAVPLVRRTGGLNDIITDYNPATGKGDGFSFTEKNPWSLFAVIIEALTLYKQPTQWKKLVLNCLRLDFSWYSAAESYSEWYRDVIEERKRARKPLPHPAYRS